MSPVASTSLKSIADEKLKADIVQAFWNPPRERIPNMIYIKKYKEYFDEYYRSEIKAIYESGIETLASKMAAKTHQHIIEIVRVLWANNRSSKMDIAEILQAEVFPQESTETIGHAIDFALRVWLMINVKDVDDDGAAWIFGEVEPEPWSDDSILEDFVRNRFPKDMTLGEETLNIALRDDFTGANLQRIGGFKITWTRNIEDHLSMSRDHEGTRTVNIFPYRSCLEAQLRCRVPIPESVLRETIMSLDVLFPSFDPRTQAFLRESKRPQLGTGTSARYETRYIRDFQIWRQRMAELYLEYKDQPGRLWADRRNPQEWLLFVSTMVGVLFAVAFGIISIVTACMSTHYTRLGYELALQQASASASDACVTICPGVDLDQRNTFQVMRAHELQV
ncbi:hypothetical protein PVAG01_10093 [Phlyctema vagabunda]|uniref:Uncharacterized protein n=1 Tax=Phlyctema vagabunda TaxID=108571 RepID=A0ABR4P544_9HELO